jgi:hypothetical protein
MRISSDSWGMARSSEWRTQTPLKGLPEDRLHVQGVHRVYKHADVVSEYFA